MDYKHTWVLKTDSKLIRYYAWAWRASPRRVDFCKLFWGVLFSPFGFVITRLASFAVRFERRKPPPGPASSGPGVGERSVERIATFFAVPRNRRRIARIGKVLLVLLGLGLLALVVVWVITSTVQFLVFWATVAAITGLVFLVAVNSRRVERWAIVVGAVLTEVKRNTCPRVVLHDEEDTAKGAGHAV